MICRETISGNAYRFRWRNSTTLVGDSYKKLYRIRPSPDTAKIHIGEQFRTAYSGEFVGLLNKRVAFQLPCELFGAPHYFFEQLINGRSPHKNDPLRNFQLRDIDGPSIRATTFTYHASTPSRQELNMLVAAQITCSVWETIRDTNVTRHIIRRQLTTRLTARSAHSRLTH